jgi:hypothetical protein
MKRAILAVVFSAVLGVATAFALSGTGLPASGRFEQKWGSTEAFVRNDLRKREIPAGASVEVHPGGRDGVRFSETAARPVLGKYSSDIGVLYVFIDGKLVAVTVGFTMPVAETTNLVKALKATYQLADAVSPSDELVITDWKADEGHVIVYMTLSDDHKSVVVQVIFMAEMEYQHTVASKRQPSKDATVPGIPGSDIRLQYTP